MLDSAKQFYEMKNIAQRYRLKAFLSGTLLSLVMLLPFVVSDSGYFLFYGDFNVQEVPFYQMIHDSIREGDFFWSWTTDLGANTISSYSFYMMGSPFFWVTLLFPGAAVPYLMAPLLILKFGCASLFAYMFLKRYVIDKNYAVLGAVLYVFSGFSIYNIFFNHFHEAILIFPLLLCALDSFVIDKRRGLFALVTFAACFINYYFFTGMVVFCFIYFIIRVCYGSYRVTVKEFLLLCFEAILGFFLAAVLFFPTILTVSENNRVNHQLYGWDALIYQSKPQRYIHLLESFFFPPDIPARPNFTPDSDAKWSSIAAWLPLIGISGIVAWINLKRKHWLKTMLIIFICMAFVPILNSTFQFMNSAFYTRWLYMLVLIMCLASVMALENTKADFNRALKWTLYITLAIALTIGLIPKNKECLLSGFSGLGLEKYQDRFWIYVAIALLSILVFTFIMGFKDNRKLMFRLLTISVVFMSLFYSIYIISLGKNISDSTHGYIIPYCLNGGADISLPDEDEFCRIDTYETMDNTPMFWQRPTIQAFHTVVPNSIMEFYPAVGVTRDVGSRPKVEKYGIRALTSVRWLFDYDGDDKFFGDDTGHKNPKMPGYTYYANQNGFDIWENNYYIPMGFTYDNYITEGEFYEENEDNRHFLVLKSIVLGKDAVERNSDILEHISNTSELSYTKEDYFKNCRDRKSLSCYEFKTDNQGFSAKIDLSAKSQDELVFFSVPYEDGWSSTVNGVETTIEKTNIGFMAVRTEAGRDNDIRFNYKTPGLQEGFIVTAVSAGIFIAYILILRKRKQLAPETYPSISDINIKR